MTPASNSETPESNSNLNPVLPENPEQNSPSPISNLDDISEDIDLSTELGEEKENQSSSESQIPQPEFYLPVSQATTDEGDEIPDEVEMGFFDHLEELRQRIFYVLIAVFIAIIGCFAFVNPIVQLLQRPASGIKFVQLAPGEYFFVSLKVAGYSGLVVATPFILYQITMFVLPGLTRKERRLLVPTLLGSSVLFLLGLGFAYIALIPAALNFFVSYGADVVEQFFSIEKYFEFVLVLLFCTGIAFQIPVIQAILGGLKIVSSQQMLSGWRYVILGGAVLGAVLTPSTDPLTQSLLAGAILGLYFGGIGIVKMIENTSKPSQNQ
ncbi:Sec-independent protein translocase protein TatC [Planktothrix agardhii]|jgi:sec-independent protein translocase protein TatC|uniref:Sec-independent protein translocase protein TatC n=1 Tax=Planktothrix agardhii TaxID=1160 RepID=A0A1J1JFQ4_PLAAG|nr:twin-arginine translocase subunit TatC [Planktothrix agardhii]MCF3574055.1 twin-arginine translocase subunit TatC [Planktothrix agardhii 1812]MCF3581974.1 twin-arginine translocase subunit TatC [Planktothrix agardhii 1811]MCF3626633.1 twin-arginine translocase subunit TatC [Planktothrix agardhii 1801]CAD5949910.1 Sec-independent protein translocase protein TatC [Planktothrix agardhii]CAD5973294.1 Sec-independent protein translocase protein TatC [Planktothrix agardhii]